MTIGFTKLAKIKRAYNSLSISACVNARATFERHANLMLFLFGIVLLSGAGAEFAHAGKGSYGKACHGLLQLLEGTFGALLTAAAGVGAVIASAVGGFKMAWSLIVVSVGAFILRSYITLFNGTCA